MAFSLSFFFFTRELNLSQRQPWIGQHLYRYQLSFSKMQLASICEEDQEQNLPWHLHFLGNSLQQKNLFLIIHRHLKPLQCYITTFMGEICWLIDLHRKCCFSVYYTKPLQYDVMCRQCVNSPHSLRPEPLISHATSCPNMWLTIILHATVSFSSAVCFFLPGQ